MRFFIYIDCLIFSKIVSFIYVFITLKTIQMLWNSNFDEILTSINRIIYHINNLFQSKSSSHKQNKI